MIAAPRCSCNGKLMKFHSVQDDLEHSCRWYTHTCEECRSMCLTAVKLTREQHREIKQKQQKHKKLLPPSKRKRP